MGRIAPMRRRLRVENFGAIDHVLNRGGRREEFFPALVVRPHLPQPPAVKGGRRIDARSQAIRRCGGGGLTSPRNEPSSGLTLFLDEVREATILVRQGGNAIAAYLDGNFCDWSVNVSANVSGNSAEAGPMPTEPMVGINADASYSESGEYGVEDGE